MAAGHLNLHDGDSKKRRKEKCHEVTRICIEMVRVTVLRHFLVIY